MEIGLDEYLKAEKAKLEKDKLRLDISENDRSPSPESQRRRIPSEIELKNANQNIFLEENSTGYTANHKTSKPYQNDESNVNVACPAADLIKLNGEVISQSNFLPGLSMRCNRNKTTSIAPKASADFSDSSNVESDSNLSKVLKERLNARRSGGTSRHNPQERATEESVSDTFYSYFPSIKILDKKRENLAKDRQQDYQNYLKGIAASESRPKRNLSKQEEVELPRIAKNDKSETNALEYNVDSTCSNNDEIITTENTKFKLLQDLKHTALSNMVNGDGAMDRNRIRAENENKKKLEYQKQLMIQIEEKRREIQALKEKEKLEEELLAKKLEEQLKSMQLEDELKKEQMRVEKARILNEQNQEMRMQLLSKLENDKNFLKKREVQSKLGKESIFNKDNEVYKYFSNSARYNKYNKYGDQKFFDANESDESQLAIESNFPKAFSNISCSLCNCKRNLKNARCNKCEKILSKGNSQYYSMSCEYCQEQYHICLRCEKTNTPCPFCHRWQSVCSYCIRNVCPYCGNLTRNSTPSTTCRSRLEDSDDRSKSSSIRSFKVLDISYNESADDECQHGNFKMTSSQKMHPMNIEKTSLFHPETKGIGPKYDSPTGEVFSHQCTNERLSRYLKNYGDLTSRISKSTQTGRDSDRGDSTISIPLLRELPKMNATKAKEDGIREEPESYKMKQLTQKWEIPVVQKNIISNSSPRVLTQLGAIRKQLQMEHLELDVTNTKP